MRNKKVAFVDPQLFESTGKTVKIENFQFLHGRRIEGDRQVYRLKQHTMIGEYEIQEDTRFVFVSPGEYILYCKKNQLIGKEFLPEGSLLFFQEEELSGVILNKEIVYKGIKFKDNSMLYFHPNGELMSGTLKRNTLINGHRFKANTTVDFYDNGTVSMGTLANVTKINNVTFIEGTLIGFRKDGSLEYSELKKDTFVGKYKMKKDSHLFFFQEGNLHIGMLAKEEIINGIKFPVYSELTFDKNNKVLFITVAAPTKIRKVYPEGTVFFFRGNGVPYVPK